MATAGRKKKSRSIEIDFKNLPCTCYGPTMLTAGEILNCEKVALEPDEFQTLVYQDIEKYTMAEWCAKMWISKTVYAGLYEKAREKTTYALLYNCVLTLACPI